MIALDELVAFIDGLIEGWELYADSPIPDSSATLLSQIKERVRGENSEKSKSAPSKTRFADIRFEVALSFPGTERDYVSTIATQLQTSLGVNGVFYDSFYQAHLAKPDLDTLLQDIYRNRASLVVVFLGGDYAQSDWCGLEWRAVRDIIKEKTTDQLMFVRFDDTPIEGTFGIDGYIDARKFPAGQTAKFILERVADISPGAPPPTAVERPLSSISTDETKRQRDIEALRWALESIHLPTLDDMIEGLPRYVRGDAMHFWEGFNGVVRNSLFHIYDSDVSELIREIHQAWGSCFDGSQYHSAANPNLYVFAIPGDMPLDDDQQRAWDRIASARDTLRVNIDELLKVVRDRYLEIDIRETNSAAWKEFVDFNAEFEAFMNK